MRNEKPKCFSQCDLQKCFPNFCFPMKNKTIDCVHLYMIGNLLYECNVCSPLTAGSCAWIAPSSLRMTSKAVWARLSRSLSGSSLYNESGLNLAPLLQSCRNCRRNLRMLRERPCKDRRNQPPHDMGVFSKNLFMGLFIATSGFSCDFLRILTS